MHSIFFPHSRCTSSGRAGLDFYLKLSLGLFLMLLFMHGFWIKEIIHSPQRNTFTTSLLNYYQTFIVNEDKYEFHIIMLSIFVT